MKQLSLLLLFAGIVFSSSAQTTNNCQDTYVDTVLYVEHAKTSGFQELSMKDNNDAFAPGYGYVGYAQRFEAPDSIKVLGFCFRGFVFSGSADTVVCKLYKADGSGMPGALIDTAIVSIPLVSGFSGPYNSQAIKNCVTFDGGHVIEGDYILTVENLSTSDVYIVRNNVGDGATEDLSLTYYRGVSDPSWDGWYKCYGVFGATWDFDLDFEPLIEYAMSSESTISADSICSSDTLMVSDTLFPFDDSIFYNKMYNPNYASYNGYTVGTGFDYGDGNSGGVGSHVYSATGNYTVTATDSIYVSGWTNNFFEMSCSNVVNVNGASLGMDTTICMQSSMVLSPGVFDTYSWNTGQTTDSIIVGPILNPGVITYTVDVTSDICNASASVTITFNNCIGIEETEELTFQAYPNPVSSVLTIETEINDEFNLVIYDYQGKEVLVERMIGNYQTLDVSGLEQGVYIVSIANNDKVVRKKLQILR